MQGETDTNKKGVAEALSAIPFLLGIVPPDNMFLRELKPSHVLRFRGVF